MEMKDSESGTIRGTSHVPFDAPICTMALRLEVMLAD